MYMPKSRPRYSQGSHEVGSLVEFIGRDYRNRGIGIILEQSRYDENYVRVFWQGSRLYEDIHKAKIRRVIDVGYV